MNDLLSRFFKGDRKALARIMTLVDNRSELGIELMNQIYPKGGRAHVIGFTGPPGVGKSTLVNKVISEFRQNNLKVGILAIDPSSPFSQGALLGDRIRMLEFTKDENVFIRSIASRGHLGGLSQSTFDCINLLDVFGFDIIIVETVGAGQSEVDVVRTCDTTIVLTLSGLGDDIQIIKAGIMEIADIFVVNKSDRTGSKELASQIIHLLMMNDEKVWTPPVCLTTAIDGTGVPELIQKISEHHKHLLEKGKINLRKERFKMEFKRRLSLQIISDVEKKNGYLDKMISKIIAGEILFDEAISATRKLIQDFH